MAQSSKTVINFDDVDQKRKLLIHLGTLRGRWRVEIKPDRAQRSSAQNRWYWSCLATPLAQYLSEQDYDITSAEQAHEILRARFLTVDVVNRATGEVVGQRVRSSTELDTAQFADFCERSRTWMADFFNIIVPDPEPMEPPD